MNIKKTVYDNLHKKTKVKFDEKTLVTDLEIDSLDLVILVTEAEQQLKTKLTDEQLEEIKTVGDIIKMLEEATKN